MNRKKNMDKKRDKSTVKNRDGKRDNNSDINRDKKRTREKKTIDSLYFHKIR
jgi:hypothetical protein